MLQSRSNSNTKQMNIYPTWSPDGEKIAFWRSEEGYDNSLWTTNSNGGEQKPLTNPISGESSESYYWSPDSKKIAFMELEYNTASIYHIWRINIDGTCKTRLTNGEGERLCGWSPDGKKILYEDFPIPKNIYLLYLRELIITSYGEIGVS